MVDIDRKHALMILNDCDSLATADALLCTLEPQPSRAMRWGIWDGFSGRAHSTSGLMSLFETGTDAGAAITREYDAGYQLGGELVRLSWAGGV